MASINNPINNDYYYFSASANERFANDLDHKLSTLRKPSSNINWWNSNHPTIHLHCTLGSLSTPKMSQQEIQDLNTKLKNKTIKNLKNNEAIFNKVDYFDITQNGAIILKFKPNKQMTDFHEELMSTLEKEGLNPGKFTHQHFLPHVTVGCMKITGSKQKAVTELNTLLQVMNKQPFPFIVYDMNLDFAQTKNNKLVNDRVMHWNLNRRTDLGILKTKIAKNNPKEKEVQVSTKANAEKLARTLKNYYGITSSKNHNLPKTVRTATKAKGVVVHTLRLNDQQFEKVKGNFDNLG